MAAIENLYVCGKLNGFAVFMAARSQVFVLSDHNNCFQNSCVTNYGDIQTDLRMVMAGLPAFFYIDKLSAHILLSCRLMNMALTGKQVNMPGDCFLLKVALE